MFPPGVQQIDQALGGPVETHQHHELRVGAGDATWAAATAFATGAAHAPERDHFGGADDDAVRAKRDGLHHVPGGTRAAADDQGDSVADAFGDQELVHFRDRVFDGHRDVLLGDVGCRAGAAIAAVQMDDVGACVVAADRDHVDIVRGGHLYRDQGAFIHFLDPIEVLLVILDGVHAVKRERREQGIAGNRFPHARDRRRVLVAEQVAAQTGLGALGVFEFDDRHALDGVFAHAEKTGRNLRDDVVVVGLQAIVETALARAREGVPCGGGARFAQNGVNTDRAKRHAAAVDWKIDVQLRSAVIAVIEVEAGVDLGRIHLHGRHRRKIEVDAVEAAARLADPMFEPSSGDVPGFGHVPGGQNQIRRPARVAHGIDGRIAPKRQGLLGALGDTIMVGLRALRADA